MYTFFTIWGPNARIFQMNQKWPGKNPKKWDDRFSEKLFYCMQKIHIWFPPVMTILTAVTGLGWLFTTSSLKTAGQNDILSSANLNSRKQEILKNRESSTILHWYQNHARSTKLLAGISKRVSNFGVLAFLTCSRPWNSSNRASHRDNLPESSKSKILKWKIHT